MENIEEMSNKISDLENDNMKNFSENVQREIESGKSDDYMNQNLEEMQQMQLKQLQELQKIQEAQLKEESDSESESESEIKEKKSKKKKSKSYSASNLNLFKEPILILFLYVFISHKFILENMSKFIPSLVSENDDTLINLFVRGLILVSIYFVIKMFIL